MSDELDKHWAGKRLPLNKSVLRFRNGVGVLVPPTLWRCECGRRFRGDGPLHNHLDRAGHHFATGVGKNS